MTKTEELAYLYDILSESRDWNVTDPRHNAVELEVDLRIKNIIKELGLYKPGPLMTKSDAGRVRPSELKLVPGLSLAQYKYRARTLLKNLSEAEIERDYEKYKLEYAETEQAAPTPGLSPAPEPEEETLADIVDNVVERSAREQQQLSACEKMKQEEQMWAQHYREQYAR